MLFIAPPGWDLSWRRFWPVILISLAAIPLGFPLEDWINLILGFGPRDPVSLAVLCLGSSVVAALITLVFFFDHRVHHKTNEAWAERLWQSWGMTGRLEQARAAVLAVDLVILARWRLSPWSLYRYSAIGLLFRSERGLLFLNEGTAGLVLPYAEILDTRYEPLGDLPRRQAAVLVLASPAQERCHSAELRVAYMTGHNFKECNAKAQQLAQALKASAEAPET